MIAEHNQKNAFVIGWLSFPPDSSQGRDGLPIPAPSSTDHWNRSRNQWLDKCLQLILCWVTRLSHWFTCWCEGAPDMEHGTITVYSIVSAAASTPPFVLLLRKYECFHQQEPGTRFSLEAQVLPVKTASTQEVEPKLLGGVVNVLIWALIQYGSTLKSPN